MSEMPRRKMETEIHTKQLKRLLSVPEAATYLGLAPRTIYNAIAPKSKKPFPIKPKRIGKLVRFDIKDLERFCDQLTYD